MKKPFGARVILVVSLFLLSCTKPAPKVNDKTVPQENIKPVVQEGIWRLEAAVARVDEEGIVEPQLAPGKLPSQGRQIHHFKGQSAQMVLDGNKWVRDQGGKVFKATLRIKNLSKAKESLALPLLTSVVLHTGGEVKKAVAFYTPRRELFVEIAGQPDELDVMAGESIELLYFIPTFQGQGDLEVLGLGTTPVNSP